MSVLTSHFGLAAPPTSSLLGVHRVCKGGDAHPALLFPS